MTLVVDEVAELLSLEYQTQNFLDCSGDTRFIFVDFS